MVKLGSDVVTIVKPTLSVDSVDNTDILSFDTPTLIVIKNCNVQPFLISAQLQIENTNERDYARTTWRLYMPINTDTLNIQPHDRIRLLGDEYEIYGIGGAWRTFSGSRHHIQYVIQQRRG